MMPKIYISEVPEIKDFLNIFLNYSVKNYTDENTFQYICDTIGNLQYKDIYLWLDNTGDSIIAYAANNQNSADHNILQGFNQILDDIFGYVYWINNFTDQDINLLFS